MANSESGIILEDTLIPKMKLEIFCIEEELDKIPEFGILSFIVLGISFGIVIFYSYKVTNLRHDNRIITVFK